jgi:hypothetical protein
VNVKEVYSGFDKVKYQDWLDITFQLKEKNSEEEKQRVYLQNIDYLDGKRMVEPLDEFYGASIDCLVFSKLFQVVVVVLYSSSIPDPRHSYNEWQRSYTWKWH